MLFHFSVAHVAPFQPNSFVCLFVDHAIDMMSRSFFSSVVHTASFQHNCFVAHTVPFQFSVDVVTVRLLCVAPTDPSQRYLVTDLDNL